MKSNVLTHIFIYTHTHLCVYMCVYMYLHTHLCVSKVIKIIYYIKYGNQNKKIWSFTGETQGLI